MSPERNGIDNRELNTAFSSPGDSFVYPRIARLFLPFPKSPACSCVSIRLPCCILGLWPKHLEGSKSESSRPVSIGHQAFAGDFDLVQGCHHLWRLLLASGQEV